MDLCSSPAPLCVTASTQTGSIQGPEALTQHVDDPFVVRREQAYGVLKEQHEGGVDDSVGQLVGVGLKEEQRRKGEVEEPRARGPAAASCSFTWKSSSASSWF